MNDFEKLADFIEKSLAVKGGSFVVKGEEEFNIANQVGDAELNGDVEVFHVFSVGVEVVAADDAVELFAQNVDEDFRAA